MLHKLVFDPVSSLKNLFFCEKFASMTQLYMPVRPAKTHQIIARNILLYLTKTLDLQKWQPIQEAALRDDDEKSLSADVTVFDKEENAKLIQII